ncbi:MAG: hypothetical protein WC080_04655 [Patescibacteria group bacterium]
MQYLLGLISGILATGFGVLLTFRLESQQESKRDTNIFEAFKEEIISNLEMLSANCIHLEEEISILEDKHLLSTLTPYYFSTWDILKTHLPKELAGKETFRQLALTMHLILLINNEIASRELYKINNLTVTNFGQTLKKKDQILLDRNVKLLTRILELKKELGLEIEFNSPSPTLMEAMGKTPTTLKKH